MSAYALLVKARIKQHTRTLPSGKVVVVRAHNDSRTKQAAEPSAGKSPPAKSKSSSKKMPSPVPVPAGADITSQSFEVKKVGHKWLTVTNPGKGFQMQLALTPETAHFKVGDTIENLPVGEVREASKYGTKVTFYPLSEQDVAESASKINEAEIKKWLGWVEEKAKQDGYLYGNGVAKLRDLGIADHPELQARLDAARDHVEKVKAAKQEKAEAAKKNRALFPISDPPEINTPVNWHGRWVVFEGAGKPFSIDESHPSTHGSHLLGHEGDKGSYFYLRDATPEEIQAAEAQGEKASSSPSGASGFEPGQKITDKWGDEYTVIGPDPDHEDRVRVQEVGFSSTVSVPKDNFQAVKFEAYTPESIPSYQEVADSKTASAAKWKGISTATAAAIQAMPTNRPFESIAEGPTTEELAYIKDALDKWSASGEIPSIEHAVTDGIIYHGGELSLAKEPHMPPAVRAKALSALKAVRAQSAPKEAGGAKLTWSDEDWEKHHVPPENTNYRTHKRQLDLMRKYAEAGDVEAIRNMTFGVNTYGRRRKRTANALLEAMGQEPLAKSWGIMLARIPFEET